MSYQLLKLIIVIAVYLQERMVSFRGIASEFLLYFLGGQVLMAHGGLFHDLIKGTLYHFQVSIEPTGFCFTAYSPTLLLIPLGFFPAALQGDFYPFSIHINPDINRHRAT